MKKLKAISYADYLENVTVCDALKDKNVALLVPRRKEGQTIDKWLDSVIVIKNISQE